MANRGLQNLRQAVLSRQKDVNRKISSYSNKGVKLSGTNFDPRISTDRIARMTRSQLNSLSGSLDSFMSRSNQFVGDFKGAPIHISVWREFKKSEARYNKRLTDNYNRFKDISITPMKKTVDERRKHITPAFPHMANSAVNAPYEESNIKPTQIAGKNAMAKMIGIMGKKADKGYTRSELARSRVEFQQMIDIVGDKDLESKFKDLTDDQVHLLWNYTNFTTRLSVSYSVKMRIERAKKPLDSDSDKFSQSNKGAHDLMDWVKTQVIESPSEHIERMKIEGK